MVYFALCDLVQAAYLLPAMHAMLSEGLRSGLGGDQQPIHTLVVAPTRELADQIQKESIKFAYCTGIKSVAVYGGVAFGHQARQLEAGVHMVVGTPGRLLDVLNRGKVGDLVYSHGFDPVSISWNCSLQSIITEVCFAGLLKFCRALPVFV